MSDADEIHKLKSQLALYHSLADGYAGAVKELAELKEKLDQATDGLLKYGDHASSDCAPMYGCSCGYFALLEKLGRLTASGTSSIVTDSTGRNVRRTEPGDENDPNKERNA